MTRFTLALAMTIALPACNVDNSIARQQSFCAKVGDPSPSCVSIGVRSDMAHASSIATQLGIGIAIVAIAGAL